MRALSAAEIARSQLPSFGDDEHETQLFGRDELAQLPSGQLSAPQGLADTTPRQAKLPVPGFRSRDEVRFQHVEPPIIPKKPKSFLDDLPLGVWLVAAMLMAVASFHFAPAARDGFQAAITHLDAR